MLAYYLDYWFISAALAAVPEFVKKATAKLYTFWYFVAVILNGVLKYELFQE